MDFAASEAKKRGQSFPGTAVNLCRKRPGTDQPCPIMRPAPAGRSGPGSFQGHRSILQGRKNFSPLRGAIRAQRLWICPARSHAARTEKTRHLPGSQPAGSNSRPKAVDVPRPVTRSRDRENAPSAGQQPAGSSSRPRLWIFPTRPPQKASGTKQKRHPDRMPFCLVRITGLEPAQYCYH